MTLVTRRMLLAAGGTVAATIAPRKPEAAGLPDLAEVLVPVDPAQDPPGGVFVDAEGGEHTLASFRGRGMVVNLWATWCRPCIAEMPSLAVLSKALAPHDIAVLPLSSDRGGAKVVAAWFEAHAVPALPSLPDPPAPLPPPPPPHGLPTPHPTA